MSVVGNKMNNNFSELNSMFIFVFVSVICFVDVKDGWVMIDK